jgi:hypothetical protein
MKPPLSALLILLLSTNSLNADINWIATSSRDAERLTFFLTTTGNYDSSSAPGAILDVVSIDQVIFEQFVHYPWAVDMNWRGGESPPFTQVTGQILVVNEQTAVAHLSPIEAVSSPNGYNVVRIVEPDFGGTTFAGYWGNQNESVEFPPFNTFVIRCFPDFTSDSIVDGSDFLKWQQSLDTGPGGDIDGDGDTDGIDLKGWIVAPKWMLVPNQSIATPEPASWPLLALGVALTPRVVRRHAAGFIGGNGVAHG